MIAMQMLPLLAALLGGVQASAQGHQDAPRPAAQAAGSEAEQVAIMDRIERDVRLPEGARPLAEYGRYYAWQSREDGIRKVVAVYFHEPNPARHWVAETAFPLIMDGGCELVSISFDVATGRIENVSCNGDG